MMLILSGPKIIEVQARLRLCDQGNSLTVESVAALDICLIRCVHMQILFSLRMNSVHIGGGKSIYALKEDLLLYHNAYYSTVIVLHYVTWTLQLDCGTYIRTIKC